MRLLPASASATVVIAAATAMAIAAFDAAAADRAVRAIGDQRLPVPTSAGEAALPFVASRQLEDGAPEPDVERAVIVVHGRSRDADVYLRSARLAAQATPGALAHTLLIAPQFLLERDLAGRADTAGLLRWRSGGWPGGEAATAPAPVSSYAALDALLAMLADRRRFPALTQVVLAGHSAGAQTVLRYAVVGAGEARLTAAGAHLRYVVANPSSYLYFSADRPRPGGGFAVPTATACPDFDRWKYGWEGAPLYAAATSAIDHERRFVARDVVYLFGGADTDPQQPALDRSCAGELQGPDRLARGRAWVEYLRLRHPALQPVWHVVPGVGHQAGRMLESACGRAALFGDAQAAADCAAR